MFFISFLGFVGGMVVRRHLLDPSLYARALAETDIYERVYTELLADPAVQVRVAEVTGIQFEVVVGELYAQIVSALYLVLPPAEIQAGTEKFFDRLTAYLKGETPELEGDLGLRGALEPDVFASRVARAATAVMAEGVDTSTPILEQPSGGLDLDELASYMDQVSDGRPGPVPDSLLRASVAGISQSDSGRLQRILLGPVAPTTDERVGLQIEAALAANDLPSAIMLAARQRLRPRVDAAVDAAQPRIEASPAVDAISATSAMLGVSRESIVTKLRSLRGLVSALSRAMLPLLILMLISLGAIAWLNGDDLRTALRSIGWTLFASGAIVLGLWLVAGVVVRDYLRGRVSAESGFPGLDHMVEDVIAALSRGIWQSVWQTTLLFLILGAIALVLAYSRPLFAWLSRILAPVWERRWLVLTGAVVVFVFLPLLLLYFTADARAANAPCNGHVELCDRPASEVVYSTSHNAMSIAEYAWIWPMHDETVAEQLDSGVRALLIDTHYLDTEAEREQVFEDLPAEARETAREAVSAFQPPSLEGTYLCHQLCGFGYTPLEDTLLELRTWMDEHPREVLFLVIQDEISPEDTQNAVDASGLEPYIYAHGTDDPWPTLREMIDSGKRLVVMAENEGPPPAWYTNVWESTMETPYTFVTKEQFSCQPNRGETGKSFFLLNHWIQRISPNRVDGAIVNDYEYLLARARQCEQERGKLPNFIAVNWIGQGDVMAVVDELNGVRSPSE